MAIGQELLNVPMGDMIRQMAFAIADAQVQLDTASIRVAEMMGGLQAVYDQEGNIAFDDSRVFFGYDLMNLANDAAAKKHLEDMGFKATQLGVFKVSDNLYRVPTRLSMLELGFTPTFYQFVDTIIEVKIAIKITRTQEYGTTTSSKAETKSDVTRKASIGWGFATYNQKVGTQVNTTQVDASYSSKYSYSAEGSSLLRTKLVPIPPPPVLEERIRNLMEEERDRRQKLLEDNTEKPK